MQDLASLLDSHVCAAHCSRTTHSQAVSMHAADVSPVAAEIATLCAVRDLLAARGLAMLEGDPTPRFGLEELDVPKQWLVRYQPLTPTHERATSRLRSLLGR
jgi:hypothetical protein